MNKGGNMLNLCIICKKETECKTRLLYLTAKDFGQATLTRQLNSNEARGCLKLNVTDCPDYEGILNDGVIDEETF